MDWVSERYVRLYCRDTATWLALKFAGQAMVMQLLRVVDDEGRLDLGDFEAWEFTARLFDAPEDIAREGIAVALRLGVIRQEGSVLSIPKFKSAQSAVKTGAQRMREHRARKRDQVLRNVTTPQNQPLTETNGHQELLQHNGALRGVTRSDARLRNVTEAHSTNGHLTQVPYEDDPNAIQLPPPTPSALLMKAWERAALNGLPCGDPHGHRARLESLWAACHARDPQNPLGVFERAAKAYCEAHRQNKQRRGAPQLRWFAGDFEVYADSRGKGKTSPLIEELDRTEKLFGEAVKAKDTAAQARLGRELQRIGKAMSGHA